MRTRQSLEQHRHARHGLARMLVAHERVPRREEGSRESRDHDGVVDVADDAEAHIRVDDEYARLDLVAVLDGESDGLPSGLELRFDAHVDDAASIRRHRMGAAVHRDGDGRVAHRDSEERAPPSRRRRLAATAAPLGGRRQDQHPAEHAHPAAAAVARERHQGGAQTGATCAALAPPVDAGLQPRNQPRAVLLGASAAHALPSSRRWSLIEELCSSSASTRSDAPSVVASSGVSSIWRSSARCSRCLTPQTIRRNASMMPTKM